MSAVTQGEPFRKTFPQRFLAIFKYPLVWSFSLLVLIFVGKAILSANSYLLIPWLGHVFTVLFYISGMTTIICIFSQAVASLQREDDTDAHTATTPSTGITGAAYFVGGMGFLLCCGWTLFFLIFAAFTWSWQSYDREGKIYYQQRTGILANESCVTYERISPVVLKMVDDKYRCEWLPTDM